MRGILTETSRGWFVKEIVSEDRLRTMQSYGDNPDEYPLHPDDIKLIMEEREDYPNIWVGSNEIEFEIVEYCVDSRAGSYEEYEKNHMRCARMIDETHYLLSTKANRKRLLTQIMNDDQKLGLYNTDLYQQIETEIIHWSNDGTKTAGTLTRTIMNIINPKKESHSDQMIDRMNDDEEWDNIFHEYQMDNYPPFGGPFTDAISFEEWLKNKFHPPVRKS